MAESVEKILRRWAKKIERIEKLPLPGPGYEDGDHFSIPLPEGRVYEEMRMGDPIQVWPFYEAPEELQKLSTSGGDEDWLAKVPPHLKGRWIPWIEGGYGFGVYEVDKFELEDGSTVFIGSHA